MGADTPAWRWLLGILAIGLLVFAVWGAGKDRTLPSDPVESTKGDML